MIEKAYSADLQRKFWFLKWLLMRYTVGDFLNHLVSHDELHIDQARRALALFEEGVSVKQT
jgi:hypothetical protein